MAPSPVRRTVGRIFITGLLTVLPIVITVYFTLWVLGVATSFTVGGYLHLLLLLAIAVVLVQLFQAGQTDPHDPYPFV